VDYCNFSCVYSLSYSPPKMMLKTPKSFIGVQLESKYASVVECGGIVSDNSVSTFNGSRCAIKVYMTRNFFLRFSRV